MPIQNVYHMWGGGRP